MGSHDCIAMPSAHLGAEVIDQDHLKAESPCSGGRLLLGPMSCNRCSMVMRLNAPQICLLHGHTIQSTICTSPMVFLPIKHDRNVFLLRLFAHFLRFQNLATKAYCVAGLRFFKDLCDIWMACVPFTFCGVTICLRCVTLVAAI